MNHVQCWTRTGFQTCLFPSSNMQSFPSRLQVFPSVRLPAFLPRSDDRVEGIVEPLHRQIHHLSEGVILGAFVLVAH